MHDVIIIGGGPAGLAAAIYLARQKIHFLMIGGVFGGKTAWSADVENYLGFHLLDGAALVKKFREHLNDYRDTFEFHEGSMVQKTEKIAGGFRVTANDGTYDAKILLVATGEDNRRLDVPGEAEFRNKGVTYCATCDAPLFRDKVVHVVGGGNSAMDAALFLEKYATHVTIVTVNPELTGDVVMKDKCLASPKIKVIASTKTSRILGENFVSGIGLTGPDGTERTESTQGIFVEIGLVPQADFIDFVEKDKRGQIIVDKQNRTSLVGVWAAGDVTDITEKQIAVAVGEGSKAALDIIGYLQKNLT